MATLSDEARRYAESVWTELRPKLSLAEQIKVRSTVVDILSTAFTRGFQEGVRNAGRK